MSAEPEERAGTPPMPETAGGQAPDVVFAGHLAAGEIRLQVCTGCARQIFPPRVLCPGCGGTEIPWTAVDGSATVHSTTVVRRRADRGGDYNVSIIEFDGGARMLSRVLDREPSEVAIGDRVRAVVEKIGDEPVVAFTSRKDGSA